MNADLLNGFYLGDLLIEPLKGQVSGQDGSEHIPPKAVEVLVRLAQNPGEVVSREDLLSSVWGPGQGSPETLSHTVSTLRHALDDHPDDPVYIQTLPRRGYRLLKNPVLATEDPTTMVIPAGDGFSSAGWVESLKRRGVIQAAIAYAVLGWLLIQVADIVFDRLHIPDRFATFVTILVIAGFPIAMLLSWFLEFRDGRAMLHELSPAADQRRRFSRTYVSVIGALAIAAIAVFFYDRNFGLPQANAIPTFEAAAPPVLENSFAVLPFKNVDGSEQTAIFASGLVDDVITSLSQVAGLRVSSRGDSFTLDPDTPSQKVRERLRVAKYLEGSVETAGEEIRVIVQLIDSETGFHDFSRSFDRTSEAYFDIRDEITDLTVSTVRATLPSKAQASMLQHTDRPELNVYLLYRRGVEASRLPRSMDMISSAIGWFDAALNVDPEYAAAHAGKCSVYVDAWSEVDDPGMIGKANAACAEALSLNPNLAVVHTALGRLYESTGRLDDAEQAFDRALATDPSNLEALLGLGTVYQRQNRPDDAEAVLLRNVGTHPGSELAYNALGTLFFDLGRYEEAAEQFEYVVAINQENMNGYSNLGTAQLLGGAFTEAIATFNKSLELEPTRVAYSNLGLLYYYLGDYDTSIENHERALALASNDYLVHSNFGDSLWAAGRHDEAQASYLNAEKLAEQALRIDPNNPFTQMDLAWIQAMLKKPAAARALIEKVLPVAPDDPYTHYLNGLIHLRAGEIDEAFAAFETALAQGYSPQLLEADPQLASLAEDRRYAGLVGNR